MSKSYRKRPYYSETFKRQLAKRVLSGELSVMEASRQYQIGGKMTIYRWLRKYEPSFWTMAKIEKLVPPASSFPSSQADAESLSSLKAELASLRRLLEVERLKSEAYMKMIKLAEERYQIPIEKKSGAKQSKP